MSGKQPKSTKQNTLNKLFFHCTYLQSKTTPSGWSYKHEWLQSYQLQQNMLQETLSMLFIGVPMAYGFKHYPDYTDIWKKY